MVEILNWRECFENADTRKRQRLKSFHNPSGVDSAGYIALASKGEAGMAAFGVFLALCQLSATFEFKHRGRFLRSNGSPMTLELLAATLRLKPCQLSASLEVLASEEVKWVAYLDNFNQSASSLPPICQSSPGFVQGEGEGEGEGEDSKLKLTSPSCSDSATPSEKAERTDYRDLISWVPGDGWVGITDEILERWAVAYPALNLLSQIARASEWLLANPKKAKRCPGRFLVNWLARAQERGGDNENSRHIKTGSRNSGTANATRSGQYANLG